MPSSFRRRGRALRVAALLAAVAATAWGDTRPDADAIRRARDEVMSRAEFRYEEASRSFLAEVLERIGGALDDFRATYPTLFLLGVLAMLALLVVLLAHIVWTIRVAGRAEYGEEDLAGSLDAALARSDPAPFRERALAHAKAGRLDDAVRDLWTALLLVLDRRGAVRWAAHKAALDYRIEASADRAAAEALDLFAGSYLPGSFGRRPPDARRFEDLVAALDRLAGAAP